MSEPGSAAGPLAIAVVGAGRAGRARIRALENHPEAHLARIVSPRTEGPESLEEALADPAIDALILCTPNLLHATQARAALDARKHVAVEFPLAPSVKQAEELFQHARARERTLHVEHVELLSASQRVQRGRVPALGRPEGGELAFDGGLEGWIGDPALAGSEGLRALARLHRLVDLFGEADVGDVELVRGDRLSVELQFRAGGSTRLVEERRPGRTRAVSWNVRCRNGVLDDPGAGPPGPVFREDLDVFVSRVRLHTPPYVSAERILHVLELVEAIDSRANAP
jgi:predicted dehydrogenase